MNIWRILEIEETKDKDAIAAAYRAKLVSTHPEDDPEGFMELRRAFEEAMKAADREDAPKQDGPVWGDDPVGRWMQKVDEVYKTFSRRKDLAEWENLLQDDACVNLDTKIQARSQLLRFFMEHYFISQEVMKLLDQHFGFLENMDELVEEFPKNYLDVIVVQGMKRQEYPPYEYVTGDDSCDFDEYLRMGIQLSQCISSGNTEKGLDIVEQMKDMGIECPFLEIDHTKILCQSQRFEEAAFYLEELAEEYPEIDDVHLMTGDVQFFLENFEAARAEYEAVLEKSPKQEWGLQGKAKCMMKSGEFKEANEIFSNLMEEYPYDMDTAAWLKECNKQYIEHLKEEIKESDEQSLLMDLGWCYYQNEEYEQAIALMQYVEPDDEHKIEFESLMGRCALYAERYMKAIKHLQNWEKLLNELPETEENIEKQQKQMPFCVMLQSYAWDKEEDTKKAMELTERAAALDPKDPEPLIHKGQLLAKMWHMDKSLEAFNKAIDLKPDSHAPYVMRARSLFHMGYYSDAYNDCEKTLEIFPYELAAYVYKVKILIEVGQFDNADQIIAYLESENISGSELEFLKGYILESRGEKEAARAAYQKIVDEAAAKKSDDQQEDIFNVHDLAEIYHHMAVIQYNTPGATYNQVEELIEKGLEDGPRDVQLLEMKGEIAYERKQYDKSLEVYLKLEQIAPGKRGIYGAIDNIYREKDQWDKSLEYAEKQLQQIPSGYYYMRRGQLFAYMNRNDEAEADFKMAMQLAPELSYPYNYMGVLMENYEDENAALEYYLKAIETGERENDICEEAYHNASGMYCRKKDFAKSLEVLRRGHDMTGNNKLLYEMVVTARRAGRFDEAQELLKEYMRKDGAGNESSKYTLELAHIAREMGMNGNAFSMYKTLAEDNYTACYEIGKILFYEGNYKKAVKFLKKAIELYKVQVGSDFLMAEYCMWAAKAAMEGGDKVEARALAEEGLSVIPDDYEKIDSCQPMLEQMIGGLNTILGNLREAEEHLLKALELRKCDYCTHGYCIDACYEMIYLCLLMGRREEAMSYLAKGIETDPIDTDFREIRKQIEMGKR